MFRCSGLYSLLGTRKVPFVQSGLSRRELVSDEGRGSGEET